MKVVEFGNVSMRGNDLIISHFVFAHENDEVTVSQDHSVVARVEAICAFIKDKCPPVHELRIYSPPGFLASCPHCGSPAKMEDHRTIWSVICTSAACGAQVLGDRAPEPDGEMGDAYWDGIKQTAIDRWNTRHIAPSVAAGRVEDLQKILTGYVLAYQRHSSGASLDSVIAWGAEQREAGWVAGRRDQYQVAIDQRNRAEKAEADVEFMKKAGMKEVEQANKVHARNVELEARVKELEEQAAARLPFKPEPQGIVGNGPNAKEGDRPCWTPDCGTF